MKQFIFVCYLLFFVSSCSDFSTTNLNNIGSKNEDTVNCIPYFVYDQVYHYQNTITDRGFDSLLANINSSEADLKYVQILNASSFTELKDTINLATIEQYNYKKKFVDPAKYKELDQIFCKRKHSDIIVAGCAPIYRNIFVFKKADKIVGFGLVCYKCMLSKFVGTNLDTEDFGQSGDFKKLRNLME